MSVSLISYGDNQLPSFLKDYNCSTAPLSGEVRAFYISGAVRTLVTTTVWIQYTFGRAMCTVSSDTCAKCASVPNQGYHVQGLRKCCRQLPLRQILPSADAFLWPGMETILSSQKKPSRRRSGLILNPDNNLLEKAGCIWITSEDLELQLKIIVTPGTVVSSDIVVLMGQQASRRRTSIGIRWRRMSNNSSRDACTAS